MRQVKSLLLATAIAVTVALPGSASAVGDATYTLASYKAMATPAATPSERVMAVYMASAQRFAMFERLREKYPTLVW
jgi:hypothetical protein